ncbi:unnamed protein product [Brachionus calyciflorus]|uniref:HTH CENPB-type domain-containing protein n=1 Tax=Brachionus calyciflorus TaxID=104777 RepID=A0A814MZJ1_9BILA|nr:unnamed protein product [Brachionus calyciflorus]
MGKKVVSEKFPWICGSFPIQMRNHSLTIEALYKWYVAAKSANIPISNEIFHHKALGFYKDLFEKNVKLKDNFEASIGWISKLLERYGLESKVMNGEKKYDPNDIYSCDQAALFYRIGPNRTIVAKKDQCKGFKKDKSRVTVLSTNATGRNFNLNSEEYVNVDDTCSPLFVPNVHDILDEVLDEDNISHEKSTETNDIYDEDDASSKIFIKKLKLLRYRNSVALILLRYRN